MAEPAAAPAPADLVGAIVANLGRVVHTSQEALRLVVLCLVAEGHLIIEDFPGVGKTMLAKALARSLDCSFSRLQFTPDLLPSDVTGVNVYFFWTGITGLQLHGATSFVQQLFYGGALVLALALSRLMGGSGSATGREP